MKKLVVMSVSFLSILAMVVAASADTLSLKTYKSDNLEADGWKIHFVYGGETGDWGLGQDPSDPLKEDKGLAAAKALDVDVVFNQFRAGMEMEKAGAEKEEIKAAGLLNVKKKYYYNEDDGWPVAPHPENQYPMQHPSWAPARDGYSWLGPDKEADDLLSGEQSKEGVPAGVYAYTIFLGKFTEGDTWELSGFIAVDNAVFAAVIWSFGVDGFVNITDPLLEAAGRIGIDVVDRPYPFEAEHSLGDGVSIPNNDMVNGADYYLTLFILNTSPWVAENNPQGLYSGLIVSGITSQGNTTPEPATLLILGFGVMGAGFAARRRK